MIKEWLVGSPSSMKSNMTGVGGMKLSRAFLLARMSVSLLRIIPNYTPLNKTAQSLIPSSLNSSLASRHEAKNSLPRLIGRKGEGDSLPPKILSLEPYRGRLDVLPCSPGRKLARTGEGVLIDIAEAGEAGADEFGEPVVVIILIKSGRIALALVGLSYSALIILSLFDRCCLVGVVTWNSPSSPRRWSEPGRLRRRGRSRQAPGGLQQISVCLRQK